MTIRGYRLEVDWSGDGAFTGTLEDLTQPGAYYLLDDPELVVTVGRPEDLTSPQTVAGELTFSLNNRGKQFTNHPSSPITGLVRTGRRVRLVVDTDLALYLDTYSDTY